MDHGGVGHEAIQVDRVEPAEIDAHGLSAEEVETAFDRIIRLDARRDGSFRMLAEVPSGRRIWVIWRYDREYGEVPDVFGETEDAPVFVITALKEFDRRLRIYPQFGEPLVDLKKEPGQVWIGTVRPLAMRYGVLEDRRLVIVAAIPVLLPKSKPEKSE
jgi:hypothetical protein